MFVFCIFIMLFRVNVDFFVELRLQEEGKGIYLSEYVNFVVVLMEGKILLLVDLCGFGEIMDFVFYMDVKYWNCEYCNVMVSMYIGCFIMG